MERAAYNTRYFPHIRHKWSLACEGVLRIMTFDLDLYLQGHSTMIFHKKLLKYCTSCVPSTARIFLDGFSVHIGQCIITFDRDLYLQGHSAMTLQKKKTAKIWRIFLCPLYTARTDLDGFYPYMAWEGVSCIMTFDLDLYLSGQSAMTL